MVDSLVNIRPPIQPVPDKPNPWMQVDVEGASHFHNDDLSWENIAGSYLRYGGGHWYGYSIRREARIRTRPDLELNRVPEAVGRRGKVADSNENLQQRLANANDHFRRKATEVLNDESALNLLTSMHQDVIVEIVDFDFCENGMALAKLTAANFAEIGAKAIYITESGQRFVKSIENSQTGSNQPPQA